MTSLVFLTKIRGKHFSSYLKSKVRYCESCPFQYVLLFRCNIDYTYIYYCFQHYWPWFMDQAEGYKSLVIYNVNTLFICCYLSSPPIANNILHDNLNIYELFVLSDVLCQWKFVIYYFKHAFIFWQDYDFQNWFFVLFAGLLWNASVCVCARSI